MNIKESIDAERWEAGDHGLAPIPSVDHNASLDRIQAAVDKLIYSAVVTIELQDQRIAELEFDKANLVDRIIGLEIHKTGVIGQENRIAELEAQNLNMMALSRDFSLTVMSLDEFWEIIKKYGGEA